MGDIDFEVISATENSNKFQKTRFWKEKSIEDVTTLGPEAQAHTSVVIINLTHINLKHKNTINLRSRVGFVALESP